MNWVMEDWSDMKSKSWPNIRIMWGVMDHVRPVYSKTDGKVWASFEERNNMIFFMFIF